MRRISKKHPFGMVLGLGFVLLIFSSHAFAMETSMENMFCTTSKNCSACQSSLVQDFYQGEPVFFHINTPEPFTRFIPEIRQDPFEPPPR